MFPSQALNRSVGDSRLEAALGPGAHHISHDEQKGEDYQVKTPVFEGPLDLLLHLIRKDQLNIYDIPIASICQSYMKRLELMQQIDVNIAGEFMVMAATLMVIKSLVLIPREPSDEEEDPRLPLVAQLLEYEKFKKVSERLDQRPWLYRDCFPRASNALHHLMPVESLASAPIEALDQFQLLLCLKVCLDRTYRKPLQIQTEVISITEKVTLLSKMMESEETIDFTRLLPATPRPVDLIISFLAILELARLKFIEIIQVEQFGSIQLRNVRQLRELNVGLLDNY